jgi:hypothetical protein
MSTIISVKYPISGAKVVRGKDWVYGNQDGGEGKTGVIIEKLPNNWVTVLWEKGSKDGYSIGDHGKYDLYFENYKDALLQDAMERFPSGCSYIDTSGMRYKNVKYDYPYWYDKKMIALKEDEGLVYNNGVWAECTDVPVKEDVCAELSNKFKPIPTTKSFNLPSKEHMEHAVNWFISQGWKLNHDCSDHDNKLYIYGSEKKFHTGMDNSGPLISFDTFYEYGMPKFIPEEKKKIERMEVFPGIYVGDIVVSLIDVVISRKNGDIFRVLPYSKKNDLFYKKAISSSDKESWRLATPEEIKFYNNGGKNINYISKKPLSPLEICKNSYSVGDVVETTMGSKTFTETITQKVLDNLRDSYDKGSVSCLALKGFLYSGRTEEYAKIINKPINTNQNGEKSKSNPSSNGSTNTTNVECSTKRENGIKVQRLNFKIPVTTRTGGAGLKSSDCKIRFGSNSSYHQKRLSIS